MQIKMHTVDDIRTMDRALTPYDDTNFRDYLRDRYERTMDYLEKTSTATGRAFLNKSKEIFESINSSEALRRTRATIRSALGIRRADSLFRVHELDDLRAVGIGMQRFLMADPVIREKYHRQQCDGYSDTYRDVHKGDIGKHHYDYRRVMNGVYRTEKDTDGEEVMVREVFYEHLIEGDRELDFIEQSDIIDSWTIQRMAFEAGWDSTSRLGGTLG